MIFLTACTFVLLYHMPLCTLVTQRQGPLFFSTAIFYRHKHLFALSSALYCTSAGRCGPTDFEAAPPPPPPSPSRPFHPMHVKFFLPDFAGGSGDGGRMGRQEEEEARARWEKEEAKRCDRFFLSFLAAKLSAYI